MKLSWILTPALILALHGLARVLSVPLKEQTSWSRAVYADTEKGDRELLRLTLSQDDKYRLWTPLEDYSHQYVDAVLLKEDQFFYFHGGINPFAALRAALANLNGQRLGASTVTMQLARLLTQVPSRSWSGKLWQVGNALRLEFFYSKHDILEAYLNLVPFGGNIEGAGTAARVYFGKSPHRLNFAETLTLATIPQSPWLRSQDFQGRLPIDHPIFSARHLLLKAWEKKFPLSESDRSSLQVPLAVRTVKDLPFHAPHFVNQILEDKKDHREITSLETTLNLRLQRLMTTTLKNYVRKQQIQGIDNAALLLLDWRSMEVKAWVGSADFFNDQIQGQVNGVTAKRSPGSTLKPFAYAMAFDQGLLHPQSMLKDAPATFNGFDPENFDQEFQGPLSAEDALIRSRNLPAVQVASQLKAPRFYDFLARAEISGMKPESHYGLSTILGGMELTLEELVRLYSLFPNQGELRKIRRLKGESIAAPGSLLLSPESALMTLDILKKMPRPMNSGGSRFANRTFDVYWKTGTSQAFRDAWTLGIFGPYVLGVWLGHFDSHTNKALIGREMAAPLFFEAVDAIHASEKLIDPIGWPAQMNLKKIEVCALSGQVAGPHCHHKKQTWFIPGKSPIATCEIHQELIVDPHTGLRLCGPLLQQGVAKVFEFWPSDLLKLYQQAGLARRPLPGWDPRCQIKDYQVIGKSPQITSPKQGRVYSLRAMEEETQVPLAAVTDGDVNESYWFIDGSFVGKSAAQQTLFWKALPGTHHIQVVDDQGRADAQTFQIEVVN